MPLPPLDMTSEFQTYTAPINHPEFNLSGETFSAASHPQLEFGFPEPGIPKSSYARATRLGKVVINKRNKIFRSMFRFAKGPIGLSIIGGFVGSAIFNHLTNTQLNIMRISRASNRRLREMELGGMLEAGYLNQAAATDRQRLVQAMADSNFNGRSFIGNEAAFYRNTF